MSAFIVAINLVLVAIYVGFSMYWVDSSSDWWNSLKRPAWQPPDVIFGLIWPYNFFMLCFAAFVIGNSGNASHQIEWTAIFAVTVAGATWWGYEFYVSRVFKRAAVALVATAIMTLPLMAIMLQTNVTLFWLLVPYQVWLATAASLAIGYWNLNPRN